MNKQKQLTVKQLRDILSKCPDDSLVMFDTEAQTYDCHLVYIGSAFLETDYIHGDTPCVVLHEDAPHRG